MSTHLWPFLILDGSDIKERKEACKKIFLTNYVRDEQGNRIIITNWEGKTVHFNEHIFEHAFSESSNYRFSNGIHNKPLSERRAARILWIKEVLLASGCTIEVYGHIQPDSRGRARKRRVFLVTEEKYVVILEIRNNGEYDFISAYPADDNYINEKKRTKAWKLLEIKKPQS